MREGVVVAKLVLDIEDHQLAVYHVGMAMQSKGNKKQKILRGPRTALESSISSSLSPQMEWGILETMGFRTG